jgi:hypothetical protein
VKRIICFLLVFNAQTTLGVSNLLDKPTFEDVLTGQLSEGASLLFSPKIATWHTELQLTLTDKEDIFKQLKLALSTDRQQLHSDGDKTFDYPLSCEVNIIDFNNDGNLEVLVSVYNLDWTGQGGKQTIFGKNSSGKYHKILEDQGVAELLTTGKGGYPDIILGGPGFSRPTYRWDGTKYQFNKQVSFIVNNSPQTVSYEEFYKKQKGLK